MKNHKSKFSLDLSEIKLNKGVWTKIKKCQSIIIPEEKPKFEIEMLKKGLFLKNIRIFHVFEDKILYYKVMKLKIYYL